MINRIAQELKDYDYLLVTKRANLAYITGFPDALALIVDLRTGASTLYVSRLDYRRALALAKADVIKGYATAEIPPREPDEALIIAKNLMDLLKSEAKGRVASDTKELGDDVSEKLQSIRSIKTEEEVQKIRRALEITEEVFSELQLEGRRERDVAAFIYRRMLELGSDGVAFEPIVGSGPNSAWPHYNYGERRIAYGDSVVVDIGARYQLYCADMTRTYLIGDVVPALKDALYAVYEAAKAAEKAARENVPAKEVDLAARKTLEEYGFGKYYIHSTGHGVGVEVHELPRISPTSEDMLKVGMVFTIEPGVYINNVGGVRIENMAYLSPDGLIVLNRTRYII